MSVDLSFSDFVSLCMEADDKLRALKKNRRASFLLFRGKKPSGVRATLIWMLAREKGWHVTQWSLMQIYGVTDQLIIENARLLRQLLIEVKLKEEKVKLLPSTTGSTPP